MTNLDHTIFQLRNAIKNAEPGPYDLYTSNSFRRVGLANKYKELVYATTQRDGHPDIAGEVHLHAMVMAFNAVPALLAEIERLRRELKDSREAYLNQSARLVKAESTRFGDKQCKASGEVWQQMAYESCLPEFESVPCPRPVTSDDVRRIVREELRDALRPASRSGRMGPG